VTAALLADAARDLYRFKPIGFVYLVLIVLALGVIWQIGRIVSDSLDRRRQRREALQEDPRRFRLP
jgi:Na+-transporting methylmalonyl-CoA/oxaloacetate decarboxylase gamma subunit